MLMFSSIPEMRAGCPGTLSRRRTFSNVHSLTVNLQLIKEFTVKLDSNKHAVIQAFFLDHHTTGKTPSE
jgi:hypothetical protein